jgi:ATP-dependent Clp protease protease subunit
LSVYKKACEDCDDIPSSPFDPGKVYSEQLNFREILINGDINDSLIEKAVVPIINFNRYDDQVEKEHNAVFKEPFVREPIKILINSSGGEITACMSLVSAIKSSKTPVHTIALGKAYSAGFLALIAGHKRFAQEHASMMIHPGSGGYIGTFPSILKHADHIHELQERVNGYISEHTFVDVEELQEMCEHEFDWYMYSEEAMCRGVVDGVIIGQDIIYLEDYLAMKEAELAAAKAKEEAKSIKVAKKKVEKKPAAKTTTKTKETK